MKNKTRHVGTLKVIGRLRSSKNGGPRYEISVDGFKCFTGVDSAYGYKVANWEGKQIVAVIGTHYGNPTLDSAKLVETEKPFTETQIIALHNLEADLGDCGHRWTIHSFGRVYRSNGPTTGPTGSLGGLTSPQVLAHVRKLFTSQNDCEYRRIERADGKKTISLAVTRTGNFTDTHKLEHSVK